MTFLSRLADRLILCPSTDFIETEGKTQKWIQTETGRVEVWIVGNENLEPTTNPPLQLLLLKFPGTGGRAERARSFPANLWNDFAAQTWTINHRGYGGSDGPASLENFTQTCDAFWNAAVQQFPNHKILLYGNCLLYTSPSPRDRQKSRMPSSA